VRSLDQPHRQIHLANEPRTQSMNPTSIHTFRPNSCAVPPNPPPTIGPYPVRKRPRRIALLVKKCQEEEAQNRAKIKKGYKSQDAWDKNKRNMRKAIPNGRPLTSPPFAAGATAAKVKDSSSAALEEISILSKGNNRPFKWGSLPSANFCEGTSRRSRQESV